MTTEDVFAKRMTIIFYPPRSGVSVTDRHLTVDGECFLISKIDHLVHGPSATQVSRRLSVRVMAIEVMIAAGIAAATPSTVAIAVIFVYLILTGALVWYALKRNPRAEQLWCEYDGRATMLFESTDKIEFGQVERAVLRATEHHAKRSVR
jgi:hypothetical protein